MIGSLLKTLFGRRPAIRELRSPLARELRRALAEVHDPSRETDRLALAFLHILGPQLEQMGFELGTFPAESPFSAPQCRGYIMGMAAGVMSAEGVPATKDTSIDALIGAFGLVYGDEAGRHLAKMTVEEMHQSSSSGVALGSIWGEAEAKIVYSGRTFRATGLVSAFSGEMFIRDVPV